MKNKKVMWDYIIKLFFVAVALGGAWETPGFRDSRSIQIFVFFMCAVILSDRYFLKFYKVVRARLCKWLDRSSR